MRQLFTIKDICWLWTHSLYFNVLNGAFLVLYSGHSISVALQQPVIVYMKPVARPIKRINFWDFLYESKRRQNQFLWFLN